MSRARREWMPYALLVAVIAVLYSPAFTASFVADDYSFLRFLRFEGHRLLDGQLWYEWLIGGVNNYAVFRPMGNLYWLLHYVAFGLDATGYHIATVVFHVIAAFAAFLLFKLLTHNLLTAVIGALVFAIMPVHAEAVAWNAANYDVLAGMYFMVALVFYILYRRRSATRFYIVALGMFVLGLASKETALTLPVVMALYDFLYHARDWIRLRAALGLLLGYVPFLLVLAARFAWFGRGYRGELVFAPEGWAYYIDFNLLRVFDPLPENLDAMRWVALGIVLLFLIAFRLRPVVLLGLAWIPVTLIPTTAGGVTDRSFYIPSFGVALLLSIVCTYLLERRPLPVRGLAMAGLGVVLVGYSAALFTRNQSFVRAGQVVQAILDQVKVAHPVVPADARLVFVGVPNALPEGTPVFGVGLPEAINVMYDLELRTYKYDKFPLWLDDLDHTYFFQVDHRRVAERGDLVRQLQMQSRCTNSTVPVVTWDFSTDAQGWEAWSELDDLANRDGLLVGRATGSDAYMGSPALDIPALGLGDIELTLRVRAEQPNFTGAVFWRVAGQDDFSPALYRSFSGKADGEFHVYNVDIARSGMLTVGDRIVQLRLDPVDGPAEIAIKSVRIFETKCR